MAESVLPCEETSTVVLRNQDQLNGVLGVNASTKDSQVSFHWACAPVINDVTSHPLENELKTCVNIKCKNGTTTANSYVILSKLQGTLDQEDRITALERQIIKLVEDVERVKVKMDAGNVYGASAVYSVTLSEQDRLTALEQKVTKLVEDIEFVKLKMDSGDSNFNRITSSDEIRNLNLIDKEPEVEYILSPDVLEIFGLDNKKGNVDWEIKTISTVFKMLVKSMGLKFKSMWDVIRSLRYRYHDMETGKGYYEFATDRKRVIHVEFMDTETAKMFLSAFEDMAVDGVLETKKGDRVVLKPSRVVARFNTT